MLKSSLLQKVFVPLDILIAVSSYYFSLLICYELFIPANVINGILVTVPTIICSFMFFNIILGCYESIYRYAGFSEMIRQLFSVIAVTIILEIMKFANLISVSHSFIIINYLILLISSAGVRIFPRFFHWFRITSGFQRKNVKRVLIIGAGTAGAMIIKRLRTNEKDNQFPIAVIDDDPEKLGKRICGVKVIGTSKDIEYVAKKRKADAILIAIPSADINTIKKLYNLALPTGLPVKFFQSVVNMQSILKNGKEELVEVPIEELLNRDSNKMDLAKANELINNKVVLVTGGAGSIGSELCRQVLDMGCKELIIFDINENAMFALNEELKLKYCVNRYRLIIGSIRDLSRLEFVFKQYKPQLVFHAAAHKHVPMMESNPIQAIQNNVFGTMNVINMSVKYKVLKFILISTDKAVNPSNTMGATKRLCEMYLQSMSYTKTTFAAVRFGNVLGSNGSVVPLFKKQIKEGGPVTVTDPDITRYFMTIKEAVSLVLTAASMSKGGEIFVLNMGEPVRIFDLACNLIRSSGFEPNKDIDIVFTGLRPGEKLYEELYLNSEDMELTDNKKIMCLKSGEIDEIRLSSDVSRIEIAVKDQSNELLANQLLFKAIKNDSSEFKYTTTKKVALVR